MRKEFCAYVLTMALLTSPALLCAAEAASQPAAPARASSQDYQIGPNDKLNIEVYGIEELTMTVSVSASGSIAMPHLGRLYVAGLSPTELEDRIRQDLKSRALVKDPQVGVSVEEYNSQPIYVLGAVKAPGQFMMSRTMSVVDAITMAGGLDADKAGRYVLVRRGKGKLPMPDETLAEDEPVFRIDLQKLLEQGDVSQDVALQGGDVIQIPARKVEMFYVIGDVTLPGAYEIKDDRAGEMLASHALGSAGGAGRTANLGGAKLIRNTDGGHQEIALDFKKILKGKQEDAILQANDIIFVPGSKLKTVGAALMNSMPNLLGVLVWSSVQSTETVQPAGRR